jgi:hypothetical protein
VVVDVAVGDAGGAEPESPAQRPDFLRRHGTAVAAPLVYLACSVWLFFPLVEHLTSAELHSADASLFTWWLGWTPHALGHGLNPFLPTVANPPTGLNAMWNTSVPLLGVLVAPVTLTLGPTAALNLLVVLAPAISAWAGFLGGRLLGLRARSSMVAGFLYGFSTYELAQNGTGHLHLAMAPFPPLVAALLYRIITGATSTRRGGLLIGVAGALQLWVSEEILATSLVITVLSLAVLAIRRDRVTLRRTAVRLLRTAGWALVVALPLTLPALVIQFHGRGHLTTAVNIPLLSADVLAAVTPTPQVLAHWLVTGWTMKRIQTGYYGEITSYVGLPALVLLAVCRRRIRSSSLRWCWVPLLIAALLTLGWSLRIGGQPLGIAGPARILQHLPLTSSIVATRFSLYAVLFTALLVAAAWDSAPATVGSQRWTAAAVVLVVLAVLPWPSVSTSRVVNPAAFTAQRALPGTPEGATVAILPWPTYLDDSAMRWQAVNGFHFCLVGAYGVVARNGVGDYGTPRPTIDRVARRLFSGDHVPRQGLAQQQAELDNLVTIAAGADALVIGDTGRPGGQQAVAEYVAELLHEQPLHEGGVYVFRLSQP